MMVNYKLTDAAAVDLEIIFNYSIYQFGLNQAKQYLYLLEQRLIEITCHPRLFPTVDHIKEGYRRSVFNSHSIYYKTTHNGILIVRILGRQNIDSSF